MSNWLTKGGVRALAKDYGGNPRIVIQHDSTDFGKQNVPTRFLCSGAGVGSNGEREVYFHKEKGVRAAWLQNATMISVTYWPGQKRLSRDQEEQLARALDESAPPGAHVVVSPLSGSVTTYAESLPHGRRDVEVVPDVFLARASKPEEKKALRRVLAQVGVRRFEV